jgi:hypothetical protein
MSCHVMSCYVMLCYVGLCQHGMAHPRVADGGQGPLIRWIAANILNKQSRTADKEQSSRLGAGRGANNSSP